MKPLFLSIAGAMLLAACGNRAVTLDSGPDPVTPPPTNSECVAFCQDVRPKLINTFGVSPDEIDCLDRKWRYAADCAACKRILVDDYGVHTLGDGCR